MAGLVFCCGIWGALLAQYDYRGVVVRIRGLLDKFDPVRERYDARDDTTEARQSFEIPKLSAPELEKSSTTYRIAVANTPSTASFFLRDMDNLVTIGIGRKNSSRSRTVPSVLCGIPHTLRCPQFCGT